MRSHKHDKRVSYHILDHEQINGRTYTPGEDLGEGQQAVAAFVYGFSILQEYDPGIDYLILLLKCSGPKRYPGGV
jgi:hypothetical protein